MNKFIQFINEAVTVDYEWNRPLDGYEKEFAKKYKLKIKVINQMNAKVTGDKNNIIKFLKSEDDLIKSSPELLDEIYPELK